MSSVPGVHFERGWPTTCAETGAAARTAINAPHAARKRGFATAVRRPVHMVMLPPSPGTSSICEGRLAGDGALLADPAGEAGGRPRVFRDRVEGLSGAHGIGPRLPAIGAARDRARRAVLARVGRVGPALDVLQALLGGGGLVAATAGFLAPEGLAAADIVVCAGRRDETGGAAGRKRGGRSDGWIVGDPAGRVLQLVLVDHRDGAVLVPRGLAAGLFLGRGFAQALAGNPARQAQDAGGHHETKGPHGGMVHRCPAKGQPTLPRGVRGGDPPPRI